MQNWQANDASLGFNIIIFRAPFTNLASVQFDGCLFFKRVGKITSSHSVAGGYYSLRHKNEARPRCKPGETLLNFDRLLHFWLTKSPKILRKLRLRTEKIPVDLIPHFYPICYKNVLFDCFKKG